ncbi:LysM peptidoglycan-binding domain-containing protein [Aurantimonas sp. A2-1-M11]|uniref:LysM peptidoglycan-binding domain-containing protein n=1 Tax=Aurantimonas sp. A2-1-M11 TaxID=3113712 RepID=UPI002F929028
MQKKALGIVLVCLVLLVAIVAGYWDMLSSEKLRISQRSDPGRVEEAATGPDEGPAAGDEVPGTIDPGVASDLASDPAKTEAAGGGIAAAPAPDAAMSTDTADAPESQDTSAQAPGSGDVGDAATTDAAAGGIAPTPDAVADIGTTDVAAGEETAAPGTAGGDTTTEADDSADRPGGAATGDASGAPETASAPKADAPRSAGEEEAEVAPSRMDEAPAAGVAPASDAASSEEPVAEPETADAATRTDTGAADTAAGIENRKRVTAADEHGSLNGEEPAMDRASDGTSGGENPAGEANSMAAAQVDGGAETETADAGTGTETGAAGNAAETENRNRVVAADERDAANGGESDTASSRASAGTAGAEGPAGEAHSMAAAQDNGGAGLETAGAAVGTDTVPADTAAEPENRNRVTAADGRGSRGGDEPGAVSGRTDATNAGDDAGAEVDTARGNDPRAPEEGEADDGGAPALAAEAPRFDLLRVEPDGSTVIAGRAPADSRIALMSGTTILGNDMAGIGGDFVVVLDAPLPPGDHTITISATAPNGATTRSQETAIISVPPRDRPGELLAMVEAPNAPTRLIEMPAAEDAAPPPGDGTSQTVMPTTGEASPGASAEPAGSAETSAAGSDAGPRLPAESPSGPAETGSEPAPLAVSVPREGAVDAAGETAPSAGQSMSGEGTRSDAAVMLPQDEVGEPASVQPSTVPLLRVEAVEVEGSTVYIAGAAESGARVRVYVDNVFLAEDRADFGDRFLVTGDTGMAVGEHLVRADQLSSDGNVVARAEVPFTRPEGPSASAVAPASDDGGGERDVAAALDLDETAAGPAAAGAGAESGPANTATQSRADSATAAPDRGPRVTSADPSSDLARSEPGTGVGVEDLQSTPDDAPVLTKQPGPKETASADRGAQGEAGADDTGVSPGSVAADTAPSVETPSTPDGVASADAPPETPEAHDTAGDREAFDVPAESNADSQVPITRQPALATADGRVIIRKGDTLWEISRRTYGAGQRYTVIYLANGDQIRDPHLIYPAQVFRLPNTPADADGRADEGAGTAADGEG